MILRMISMNIVIVQLYSNTCIIIEYLYIYIIYFVDHYYKSSLLH